MNVKDGIVRELHRPARRNFTRRHVTIKGQYDLFQSDLVDLQAYSRENGGHRYILVVVDAYSKFAWARALTSKSGKEVATAMLDILSTCAAMPTNVQTDHGTEYYNLHFRRVMSDLGINHYSVYSTKKACMAERFIRTLKARLYKNFSSRGSYKWVDVLPDIIHSYNTTVHSTIKMRPCDVKDNRLLSTVYHYGVSAPPKPKFRVGDHVRLSKYKTVFRKGYLPQWSTEVFRVIRVQSTHPVTYIIEDLEGAPIHGAFYAEELQKTRYPHHYLVEKILRRKGNRVLVKWLGFPSSKNSWIATSDVL